jgi:hypothetical protein
MRASMPRHGTNRDIVAGMNSPHRNTPRPGRLGAATMWARLRPDLTLESALAALDDVVQAEDVERDTYRRPPRRLVHVGRPAR